MSGQATVFRRRGRSFVQVFARSGYAWTEVSAEALREPCTGGELGAAVRSALHASAVAKTPRRWRRSPAEGRLPELAGVTSWLGFARGAVGVAVSEADGAVTVLPMRREGGFFAHLEEQALRLPLALDATDDEALAAVLEEGFRRSA